VRFSRVERGKQGWPASPHTPSPFFGTYRVVFVGRCFGLLFLFTSFGLERGVIREEFGVLLSFFFFFEEVAVIEFVGSWVFLFLFFTGVSCGSLIDGWMGGCIAVGFFYYLW